MMMTDLILKYLVTTGEVKIPGFGTFQQKNSAAFYDEKSASLLPPGKELFFDVDFDLKDENLAQFIAIKKNIDLAESTSKIKELSNYWKSTLESKKELELPEFGNFFINDNILVFKGKRYIAGNPDNFGLEEVNLAELKNKIIKVLPTSNIDYKTSNNRLWWLFFLIPTAVIIYYATQNPELIFGKKSFENLNKITKNPVVKKDRLKNKFIKTDSISLKNKANAPK